MPDSLSHEFMPATGFRRCDPRHARGFSLIEVMIVIAILSVVFYKLIPTLSELKARSALRSGRMELTSVFTAARAAALQKGKTATLTLTDSSASVSVLTSVSGTSVTVIGPVLFKKDFGTSLTPLSAAPISITFDARGLIAPVSATISKYQLSWSTWSDTVCLSGAGIVLRRGCQL